MINTVHFLQKKAKLLVIAPFPFIDLGDLDFTEPSAVPQTFNRCPSFPNINKHFIKPDSVFFCLVFLQ